MHPPEKREQLFVGYYLRIKQNLHRLGMTGDTRANLAVGGIERCSARVAHGCLHHALGLFENRFYAPETAGGKSGSLNI